MPEFEFTLVISAPVTTAVVLPGSAEKEAEGNKLKLTPQYLELVALEALASGTKVLFGDNWTSLLREQG